MLAGTRILIVDGYKTRQDSLAACVSRWGMIPSLSMVGESALQTAFAAAAAGSPFDIILMDQWLEDMAAAELVSKLRAGQILSRLLVMKTADPTHESEQQPIQGIDGFVLKPVIASDLFDRLTSVLRGTDAVTRPHAQSTSDIVALCGRVLLAEDNAVNQKLAVRLLSSRGLSVEVANNGRQAVEKACSGTFDLILMDIQMPEMNGFEATRAIRNFERNCARHTPVVALTAHAMSGYGERCRAEGMDGYLTKPIQRSALFALLENYLPAEDLVGAMQGQI